MLLHQSFLFISANNFPQKHTAIVIKYSLNISFDSGLKVKNYVHATSKFVCDIIV